jgi:hypothetical protein
MIIALAFTSFTQSAFRLIALLNSAAFPSAVLSPVLFTDALASRPSSSIASHVSFALITALVIVAYVL